MIICCIDFSQVTVVKRPVIATPFVLQRTPGHAVQLEDVILAATTF